MSPYRDSSKCPFYPAIHSGCNCCQKEQHNCTNLVLTQLVLMRTVFSTNGHMCEHEASANVLLFLTAVFPHYAHFSKAGCVAEDTILKSEVLGDAIIKTSICIQEAFIDFVCQ
eukprot:scaffold47689_cov27-Tisochrysis_lutea.AAC.1